MCMQLTHAHMHARTHTHTHTHTHTFVHLLTPCRKFHHPNLVTFHGVCTKQGPIYIVTELMEHGCLLTYIRMRKEIVNKIDMLIDMAIQICSAMKYLEASHFIHRDLVSQLDCDTCVWCRGT